MDKIEIAQWLRQSILSNFSAEIINSLEPCVAGIEWPDGTGNSFLVQHPILPTQYSEVHETSDYIPIGQIDCSELPHLKEFPEKGVLQFSVIGGDEIWEAPKPSHCRVCFMEEPLSSVPPSSRLPLSFTTSESIDSREPKKFVCSPGWHFETYFELCSVIFKNPKWVVQVGGIPSPLQDFMENELEEITPGIRDWRLLACFDDGSHLEIGPAHGRYFFWIPRTDLSARRFDRVVLIHQT